MELKIHPRMAFMIRGGFNVFRRHLVNISLEPNNYWICGGIYTPNKTLIGDINSARFNRIECEQNGSDYIMLLNKKVLLISKEPFVYDVALKFSGENDFSEKNIYSYIKFHYVEHS